MPQKKDRLANRKIEIWIRQFRRRILGEYETQESAQQHLKDKITRSDYEAKSINPRGAEISHISSFSRFRPAGAQMKQNEYWMENYDLIIMH
jgi:hypothetical protein